jgi:hypothetical protein
MNFSPRLLCSKSVAAEWKLEKLHCRNFIFTLLAFDLLNSNTKLNFKPLKFSIHITKKRKHYGSTLRAPYKSKIAQFSLGIYRYFMNLTFYILTSFKPNLCNSSDFKKFNIKLLNSYNYFESALVTQVSRAIDIPSNINII